MRLASTNSALSILCSCFFLLWLFQYAACKTPARAVGFILVGLIPLVGALILIYFYVQDSQPGENQYGANPKDYPAQY